MQSKGNAPSAAQTRWRETVRRVGCIATGSVNHEPTEPGDIQIHHVLGQSAVRNGVPVGHWFILPLHWRLHDIASDYPVNITTSKTRFLQQYGSEKNLFMKMIYGFLMAGIELPFDMAVLNAIGGEG
jgi:hypothetical protein